jgi:hypothetical protein
VVPLANCVQDYSRSICPTGKPGSSRTAITQRNRLLIGLQEADALVGAASTPSIGNSVMGMLKRVTCQVGGGALHTWLSLHASC